MPPSCNSSRYRKRRACSRRPRWNPAPVGGPGSRKRSSSGSGSWRRARWPAEGRDPEQLRALRLDALPQLGVWFWDDRLFALPPTEAFAAGRATDVPLLLGWNSFDGSSLRSRARRRPGSSRECRHLCWRLTAEAPYTRGSRLCAVDRCACRCARAMDRKDDGGRCPDVRLLLLVCPAAQRGKVRGAAHASELPYVFDNWERAAPGFEVTDDARAATKRVHSCWVRFVRSGRPACEGASDWPPYRLKAIKSWNLGQPPKYLRTFEGHNSMRRRQQ